MKTIDFGGDAVGLPIEAERSAARGASPRSSTRPWGLMALVLGAAMLAVGCAPDDSTEEVDAVDSVQEELVSTPAFAVDGPSGTDDGIPDVPSGRKETESEHGNPGPQDLCAEPVPHPWVPKVSNTDNDT